MKTKSPDAKAYAEYYDLGSYHRPITTTSEETQRFFNFGFVWTFAFNHEESAKCFERAAANDPKCAIAYWGLAYALGPNYNKPWEYFDDAEMERVVARSRSSLALAREHGATASPVERALIHALTARCPDGDTPPKERHYWNDKYAAAMEAVYDEFPDDLDVMALYADALMNLTPWKLWDIRTGEPAPGARTLEVGRILENGLARDEFHPGLLHLYIHFMEMSAHPERALRLADNLRGLVPDAGHLNHMPTHLDILCGDYRRAIASNSRAIVADRKFVERDGSLNFYSLYRCHNYHFRIYAAMFAGQSKVALATAAELEATLPEAVLRIESPPMADWLESFLDMRVHVLVRFGLWDDILALDLPADQKLYCTKTAMIHYARGVALAATGRVPEADEERKLFQQAVARVPSSRTLFNNTCKEILAVAGAMLDGEIEYRRKDYDAAFSHLRRAIELDDGLPYDEPWGWMQPTRHAYGALLLEQGRVEEAAEVYAADLGFNDTLPRSLQHRNNVWALHGYHECLMKLGRVAEASLVKPQLEVAVAVADVPIQSSCFCRSNL